jgi:amino acid adenylation domain-containing protein
MKNSLTFNDERTGFVYFDRCDLDRSIVYRFEKTVTAAPQRIAIRSNARGIPSHVTYDQLNRAANAVALAIVKLRGDDGRPVALMCDPDDRTIAGVLGVLKAGKFYVPLDPSYPMERLALVLEDCAPSILITDSHHASLANNLAPNKCAVAHVDDLIAGDGSNNPGLARSPHALAAVFYTSGSTGRPKGVMQTHRNVLHRAMVDTNTFHIGPEDRASLLASPSYSASLRPLFGALLNGATVCPFNVAKNGLTVFAEWLTRERITIYNSVPAVFRQLVAILNGREDFSSVRLVKLGGESVTGSDFELYRKHMPSSCMFVNSLGSNEAGVIRMFIADKATQLLADGTLPVGYEIDDKEVLILSNDGRRLGHDEVGEIAVRSAFLSPGYWRQPDLTAAAFRPDSTDARKRIYLTGDLGMLAADGCLIHRGRKDFRIKIRGVRVEVEEVEAALCLHPSVQQAVVVTSRDQMGQDRLAAYVVLGRDTTATGPELRAFLSSRLAGPLIPSSFVFVDAFPLSPHGKIDRRALTRTDEGVRHRIEERVVAPRDELERSLLRICETVLGVQPIGRHDDLFDLGLDSLSLLRLIAEFERDLGQHLTPAALFSTPTIAQLAALLRNEATQAWSSLVRIHPTGSKPPFFWIHGDYSSVPLSRFLGPDQPFYALEHQGQDGRPAAFTEVETIADFYLREIQNVQAVGPYYIGGYSFGGVAALEVAQQITKQGEPVGLLVLLDPPPLVKDVKSSSRGRIGTERAHASLAKAFRRHAGNVAALPAAERIAYLQPRAKSRIAGILKLPLIERFVRRFTYRTCLAFGFRLPLFARSQYILDIYGRARRAYSAKPYCGRVILFKGEARRYNHDSDWEQMIVGDLDVHVVNANHAQIREEPYVPLWADALRNALTKAQVDASLYPPVVMAGRTARSKASELV